MPGHSDPTEAQTIPVPKRSSLELTPEQTHAFTAGRLAILYSSMANTASRFTAAGGGCVLLGMAAQEDEDDALVIAMHHLITACG